MLLAKETESMRISGSSRIRGTRIQASGTSEVQKTPTEPAAPIGVWTMATVTVTSLAEATGGRSASRVRARVAAT